MKCEEDLALTRRFCVNSIKHHESASHAAKHEFFNTIGPEQTYQTSHSFCDKTQPKK